MEVNREYDDAMYRVKQKAFLVAYSIVLHSSDLVADHTTVEFSFRLYKPAGWLKSFNMVIGRVSIPDQLLSALHERKHGTLLLLTLQPTTGGVEIVDVDFSPLRVVRK